MADRSFGVREINIVGSAGTPTISSPTNINLNGHKVAISTDVQVGRNASIVGVVTASAFYGDGSNLTGISGGSGSIAGIDTLGTSVFNIIDPARIYGNEGIFTGIVTFTNNIEFFAGNLLFTSGSGNTIVREQGSGILYVQSDEVRLTASGGIPVLASFLQGGGSTLYYAGASKFQTTNTGVVITGVCTATSFVGDGSGLTNLPGGGGSTAGISTTTTSFFNTIHATGTIDIGTTNAGVAVTHMTIDSADVAGTIRNAIKSGAGNTNAVLDIETKEFLVTDPYAGKGALISADSSGTKLYKDNALKLQTIGTGVTVTGTMYATTFSGNGSGLTNVAAASVSGATRISTAELLVTGISTFQSSVKIPNDVVTYYGGTNQLGLYYSSSVSQSRIDSTQPLYIRSDETRVVSGVGSTVATFTNGVALAFDYVNKFATTAYGVDVTGTAQVDGLVNSGITTFQNNVQLGDTDRLEFGNIPSDGMYLTFNGINGFVGVASTGSDLYLQTPSSGGGIVEIRRGTFLQKMATFTDGGSVDLYYNNSLKFRTTDTGALITGIATVSSKVVVGTAASGIEISYNGVDSFITDTSPGGETTIRTNQLKIENGSFETLAVFNENSDVKLYYDNAEKIRTTPTGVVITGILTATSFVGDGSSLTNLPASYPTWTIGANGTTDYTFTGIGFTVTTNDPVLYLARGQKYAFDNQSGGTHPFEIRVADSGVAYNHGVTNNGASTGTIVFEVPFDAPNTLFYQCTSHSGMGNTIRVYPDLI